MRLVKESRQWLRDGAPIAGATGRDYTLVGADFGKKISVKVTSTMEGRILKTQTVDAPAKVAAATLVPPRRRLPAPEGRERPDR